MRQLGKLANVGFVTIARIEAGELDPRLSTLKKLGKALNVSLTELVEHRRK